MKRFINKFAAIFISVFVLSVSPQTSSADIGTPLTLNQQIENLCQTAVRDKYIQYLYSVRPIWNTVNECLSYKRRVCAIVVDRSSSSYEAECIERFKYDPNDGPNANVPPDLGYIDWYPPDLGQGFDANGNLEKFTDLSPEVQAVLGNQGFSQLQNEDGDFSQLIKDLVEFSQYKIGTRLGQRVYYNQLRQIIDVSYTSLKRVKYFPNLERTDFNKFYDHTRYSHLNRNQLDLRALRGYTSGHLGPVQQQWLTQDLWNNRIHSPMGDLVQTSNPSQAYARYKASKHYAGSSGAAGSLLGLATLSGLNDFLVRLGEGFQKQGQDRVDHFKDVNNLVSTILFPLWGSGSLFKEIALSDRFFQLARKNRTTLPPRARLQITKSLSIKSISRTAFIGKAGAAVDTVFAALYLTATAYALSQEDTLENRLRLASACMFLVSAAANDFGGAIGSATSIVFSIAGIALEIAASAVNNGHFTSLEIANLAVGILFDIFYIPRDFIAALDAIVKGDWTLRDLHVQRGIRNTLGETWVGVVTAFRVILDWENIKTNKDLLNTLFKGPKFTAGYSVFLLSEYFAERDNVQEKFEESVKEWGDDLFASSNVGSIRSRVPTALQGLTITNSIQTRHLKDKDRPHIGTHFWVSPRFDLTLPGLGGVDNNVFYRGFDHDWLYGGDDIWSGADDYDDKVFLGSGDNIAYGGGGNDVLLTGLLADIKYSNQGNLLSEIDTSQVSYPNLTYKSNGQLYAGEGNDALVAVGALTHSQIKFDAGINGKYVNLFDVQPHADVPIKDHKNITGQLTYESYGNGVYFETGPRKNVADIKILAEECEKYRYLESPKAQLWEWDESSELGTDFTEYDCKLENFPFEWEFTILDKNPSGTESVANGYLITPQYGLRLLENKAETEFRFYLTNSLHQYGKAGDYVGPFVKQLRLTHFSDVLDLSKTSQQFKEVDLGGGIDYFSGSRYSDSVLSDGDEVSLGAGNDLVRIVGRTTNPTQLVGAFGETLKFNNYPELTEIPPGTKLLGFVVYDALNPEGYESFYISRVEIRYQTFDGVEHETQSLPQEHITSRERDGKFFSAEGLLHIGVWSGENRLIKQFESRIVALDFIYNDDIKRAGNTGHRNPDNWFYFDGKEGLEDFRYRLNADSVIECFSRDGIECDDVDDDEIKAGGKSVTCDAHHYVIFDSTFKRIARTNGVLQNSLLGKPRTFEYQKDGHWCGKARRHLQEHLDEANWVIYNPEYELLTLSERFQYVNIGANFRSVKGCTDSNWGANCRKFLTAISFGQGAVEEYKSTDTNQDIYTSQGHSAFRYNGGEGADVLHVLPDERTSYYYSTGDDANFVAPVFSNTPNRLAEIKAEKIFIANFEDIILNDLTPNYVDLDFDSAQFQIRTPESLAAQKGFIGDNLNNDDFDDKRFEFGYPYVEHMEKLLVTKDYNNKDFRAFNAETVNQEGTSAIRLKLGDSKNWVNLGNNRQYLVVGGRDSDYVTLGDQADKYIVSNYASDEVDAKGGNDLLVFDYNHAYFALETEATKNFSAFYKISDREVTVDFNGLFKDEKGVQGRYRNFELIETGDNNDQIRIDSKRGGIAVRARAGNDEIFADYENTVYISPGAGDDNIVLSAQESGAEAQVFFDPFSGFSEGVDYIWFDKNTEKLIFNIIVEESCNEIGGFLKVDTQFVRSGESHGTDRTGRLDSFLKIKLEYPQNGIEYVQAALFSMDSPRFDEEISYYSTKFEIRYLRADTNIDNSFELCGAHTRTYERADIPEGDVEFTTSLRTHEEEDLNREFVIFENTDWSYDVPWGLTYRFNRNGEIECASYNGEHCLFGGLQKHEIAFSKVIPLACGDDHLVLYGTRGYETEGHWCNVLGKRGTREGGEDWQYDYELDLTFRVTDDGDIQCVLQDSSEGGDPTGANSGCFFGVEPQEFNYSQHPGTLTCGDEHLEKHGYTGYEDTTHWCHRLASKYANHNVWRYDYGQGVSYRTNADGDIICASLDGRSCMWGVEPYELYDDLDDLVPLACGDDHLAQHGTNGYDDPEHWCSLIRGNEDYRSNNLNVRPTVNAGADQTHENINGDFPFRISLNGMVEDDGLPEAPGATTIFWRKASGPGSVIFTDENALSTTALFTAPGDYLIRLTADDSQFVMRDFIKIKLTDSGAYVPGVVGRWDMDEIWTAANDHSIRDSSGNDHHGTAFGGAVTKIVAPALIDGNTGTCRYGSFGDSQYASIPYSSKLNPVEDFTFSLWVKPNAEPAPSTRVILSSMDSTDGKKTGFSLSIVNNKWQAAIGQNGSTARVLSGPTVNFGQWTFVKVDFRATGGYFRLSTNAGASLSSATGVNYSPNMKADLIIAAAKDVQVHSHFNGDIDEVNIFNKLLSSQELRSLYQRTRDCRAKANNLPTVNAGSDQNIVLGEQRATLNGMVSDDGLPINPGKTSTLWTVLAKPSSGWVLDQTNKWNYVNEEGQVLFLQEDGYLKPNTAVDFTQTGEYTLQLSADDGGGRQSVDQVKVTVSPPDNQAPVVELGDDLSTVVGVPLKLVARVMDDGLPHQDFDFSLSWSLRSGPTNGTVTYSDGDEAEKAPEITYVTFNRPGEYTLRLRAKEGPGATDLYGEDTIVITVTGVENIAPTGSAGVEDWALVNTPLPLHGVIFDDDGLPNPPSQVFSTWAMVSGPENGNVVFENANQAKTTATFNSVGAYVISFTLEDGPNHHGLSTTYTVPIYVLSGNTAPIVKILGGDSLSVPVLSELPLTVQVQDDGYPENPTYTNRWRSISGPGTATFEDRNAGFTTVRFSTVGEYIIEFNVSDGDLIGKATKNVTVVDARVKPSAYWKMEENWTGATDEVLDSSENENHGRSINLARTTSADPAIPADITSGNCQGSSTAGLKNYPYNQGFENTFGEWSHSEIDDFNWSLKSGSTGSTGTGPSSAKEGNYYIYTEASLPNNPRKRSILTSPCFDLSQVKTATLSFDYHMYGVSTGNIELEASTDGGVTWVSLWAKSGNQENEWKTAQVNLSSYAGDSIQLRFNSQTGSSYQGDIAIDGLKIDVEEYDCISDYPYIQGFENTFGEWSHSEIDDFNWSLKSGSTGSTGTGPSSAKEGSYYIYTESSLPNYPQKRTILTSPCFDFSQAKTATLSFDYHMYGVDIGNLELEGSADGSTWIPLWSLSGDQGNTWKKSQISLRGFAGAKSVQLRLNSLTGSYYRGDVAIDNLRVEINTADDSESPVSLESTCNYGYFDSLLKSRVDIPYDQSIDMRGSFSVAFWVRFDQLYSGVIQTIFNTTVRDSADIGSSGIHIFTTGERIQIGLGIGKGDDGLPIRKVFSGPRIEEKEWVHIGFTYNVQSSADGLHQGSLKFYKDGRLIEEGHNVKYLPSQFTTMTFGGGTTTPSITGGIDNLEVYSEAVSEAVILESYQEKSYCSNLLLDNNDPEADAGEDISIKIKESATLNGAISDDGYPVIPGETTALWEIVDGPGFVTFVDKQDPTTAVTFSTIGEYTLRLTANDGTATSADELKVIVSPDDSIAPLRIEAEAYSAHLGVRTEVTRDVDGVRNVGYLDVGDWMKYSISLPESIHGQYEIKYRIAARDLGGKLRLRSADGTQVFSIIEIPRTGGWQTWTTIRHLVNLPIDLTEIVIEVVADGWNINWFEISPANLVNKLPQVTVSNDITIALPINTVELSATVVDDGLPNSVPIKTWSVVGGLIENVEFSDITVDNPTVTFYGGVGSYTLRLTVDDGSFLGAVYDDVKVTVRDSVTNEPPSVNAGADFSIALPNSIRLTPVLSDDGFPNPPGRVSFWWTLVSGPSDVSFSITSIGSNSWGVSFTQPGVYTFRAHADDGGSFGAVTDDVVVTVTGGAPEVIGHWSMEEIWTGALDEVQDQSNFQHHGQTSGGATTAVSDPALSGDPGTCHYGTFNGAGNQSIEVPFSEKLNPDGSFSLSSWVWLAEKPAGSTSKQSIVSSTDYLDSKTYGFDVGITNNSARSYEISVRLGNGVSGWVFYDTSTSLPTETWSHIALVYEQTSSNGVGQYKLYVNGDLVLTQGANYFANNNSNFYIGSGSSSFNTNTNNDGKTNYFDGLLDEVRLYDGTLSDSLVEALYEERHPCPSFSNQPPVVEIVGADKVITLSKEVTLVGTVSDDGLPINNVTVAWSKFSGPGGAETVQFTNQNSKEATARFTQAGEYILRLTANDSALTGTDEIKVTVTSTAQTVYNVALNKTARQSSSPYGSLGAASSAVDGDTNGAWRGRSVTHTHNENPAWWEVDLGEVRDITDIHLWNRTDCCTTRLSNFHVLVSDVAFTSNSLAAIQAQSGVGDYYTAGAASRETKVTVNRSGRYVRVLLSGNPLSLAEVEVFAKPVNFALNKTARQSSSPYGSLGAASSAVDGDTNGAWRGRSVTHTHNENQAWWEVDLGEVRDITDIHLWNRTDCCTTRLSNFHVLVSDVAFTSNSLAAIQAQSGVGDYYTAGAASRETKVTVNRSGRYVRVQLSGRNPLSLAETEIMVR